MEMGMNVVGMGLDFHKDILIPITSFAIFIYCLKRATLTD